MQLLFSTVRGQVNKAASFYLDGLYLTVRQASYFKSRGAREAGHARVSLLSSAFGSHKDDLQRRPCICVIFLGTVRQAGEKTLAENQLP